MVQLLHALSPGLVIFGQSFALSNFFAQYCMSSSVSSTCKPTRATTHFANGGNYRLLYSH